MAILKPFKGIRPVKEKVQQIASRPYDVLDSDEARQEVKGNPYSFLHVVKPEIDLPEDTHHYSPKVYEKGKENFEHFLKEGIFFTETQNCLYIYQLTMEGRTQTGILGCSAVEDYFNGVIKIHELTRPDKENDRKEHIRVSGINAEPVFFTYPDNAKVDFIVDRVTREIPEYDFTAEDGIRHTLWVVNDTHTLNQLVELFLTIPFIYVADGHHRTAAAALVGKRLKENNPGHSGKEEYNFFMSVLFPASHLKIFDYNRLLKDLNGLTTEQFLEKLQVSFYIEKKGSTEFRPMAPHQFSLYLDDSWFMLKSKTGSYNDQDPIGQLDVTILSEKVLSPILNITDLRRDKRIDFVGGIRGLSELKHRVDSGEMKAAFALYPVSIEQLFLIADTGNIMPPKTTWFEPKLRSGLVIHGIRD